jgi:hypothetical protein
MAEKDRGSKPWFVLGLMALLVASGVILLMRPATSYALDENKCLACHGNPSFFINGTGTQKISLYVDQSALDTSAHRYIDCVSCHPTRTTYPHPNDTPLTKQALAQKCGTCHQYEYKLHLTSIHGQQLALGNNDVATCADCHSDDGNPHNVKRVLQPDSSTFTKSIADTCGKCHNNQQLMASYGILENVYQTYMRSFHGKATLLASTELTQLDKATCISCHGAHDIKSVSDPNSPVAGRDNLAQVCEKCHPGAGVKFASSFLGHKDSTTTTMAPVHIAEIVFSTLLKTVVAAGAIIILLAIFRYSRNRWKE